MLAAPAHASTVRASCWTQDLGMYWGTCTANSKRVRCGQQQGVCLVSTIGAPGVIDATHPGIARAESGEQARHDVRANRLAGRERHPPGVRRA